MVEHLFLFLSDFLMFSPQNYLRLMANYNQAIWPWQIIMFLLGALNLFAITYDVKHKDQLINLSLFVCWVWVGIFFHHRYFSVINWAAQLFVLLFVLQALVFLIFGVLLNKIRYRLSLDTDKAAITQSTGLAIFIFSLVFYPPLTAYIQGDWARASYFGVAADPTCTATLGLLLMSKFSGRWYDFILPFLWCLISVTMSWLMFSKEALIILFMALLSLITLLILVVKRHIKQRN